MHPNLLQSDQSVLLLIDLQPKLTAAMPEPAAHSMLVNSQKLCTAAGLLNIPVLVTEQYPQGLGTTEPALAERLPASTQTFSKTAFSACGAAGFEAALQDLQRTQVVLAGQETHVCILQTALALQGLGYQTTVVEDATCSRNQQHQANAMQRLLQQGITINNYESVLFEWLGDAKHPVFKQISALLR